MEASNSYFGQLDRIGVALERVAEGFLSCLRGRTFDFSTDDGVRAAVAEVVRKMGGTVANA